MDIQLRIALGCCGSSRDAPLSLHRSGSCAKPKPKPRAKSTPLQYLNHHLSHATSKFSRQAPELFILRIRNYSTFKCRLKCRTVLYRRLLTETSV